jgi:hypothetical protein
LLFVDFYTKYSHIFLEICYNIITEAKASANMRGVFEYEVFKPFSILQYCGGILTVLPISLFPPQRAAVKRKQAETDYALLSVRKPVSALTPNCYDTYSLLFSA